MNWNELKEILIVERGYACELCGGPPDHNHHAIVYRDKRFKPWLDDARNALLVCAKCHVHSPELRKLAWRMNVTRYGREMMLEWLESSPMINVPRAEWLDGE